MTRVAVVATGGTIASTASAGGVVASRAAADLLQSTHVTDIDVETVDLMTVGSYRMNLGHIRLISDAVADLLARETDPIDGIVITHGTDTTEETAVLLDLVHDDPRPVVLTGAQRASDAADGDGPRNLADAILVAASPRARGLGVLIAFAGRVLPARGTRKVHTAALAAFGSVIGAAAVGEVVDGSVAITATPRRPTPLPRPSSTFDHTRLQPCAAANFPAASSICRPRPCRCTSSRMAMRRNQAIGGSRSTRMTPTGTSSRTNRK